MDTVNHPPHYCDHYEHEVIELTQHLSFCLGNAAKYILRAPYKGNAAEDYGKAKWYVSKAFDRDERISEEVIDEVDQLFPTYASELLEALCTAFSPDTSEDVRDLMITKLELQLEIAQVKATADALASRPRFSSDEDMDARLLRHLLSMAGRE